MFCEADGRKKAPRTKDDFVRGAWARPPLEGAVSEADWGSSLVLQPSEHAERC